MDVKTINGTEITLIKLTTAVKEIDNATSPLANLVKTFEVTPPGAAAIIITPIAISIGVFKNFINPNAMIGNKTIWQKKPTKKSFGVCRTLLKSLIVNSKPRPNIINARRIGAIELTISMTQYGLFTNWNQ